MITKATLAAAGLRPGELAIVLGVHPTTVSDMLNGKTKRPTPGAESLVWLWPRLSDSVRATLLAGEQFVDASTQQSQGRTVV